MAAKNTAVKQALCFLRKKNTKTDKMLLHSMVNHITRTFKLIISIKMLKSSKIQNGRQKYIH